MSSQKEAFVALVTCFNDDETINFDATRAQVRRQVAAGKKTSGYNSKHLGIAR